MPVYLIDTVEKLDNGEAGVQLFTYRIEADSTDLAMDGFFQGAAEVVYEGQQTEAVIVGIEEAAENDLLG